MRGRNGAWARSARRGAIGAVAAALATVGSIAVSATAQDATPAADPASPVAIASPAARSVDCAEPLGLAPGSACVLLVHAAAGAPDVDVSVDGDVAVEGLAFGEASPFLALPPGEHQIQVTEAGGAPEDALLDLSLALEGGLAYEVAALTQEGGPTAAILSTNLDPLDDDRARVRVFQAIPGAPPAEVALAGGDTVIADIEYGSATGYAEVPAGATPVDLEVRAAGLPIAFLIAGATLEPGSVYTFYALGDVADPASLGVLPVVAPASGSADAGTQPASASPIPLTPGTPAARATPTT